MGCGKQQTKRTSKKLEHNICYCVMTRGRIGIPVTPKTELPMTISKCFILDRYYQKEVHPRRCRDPKFLSGENNAKQSRRHTVGLRSTSRKVYPGHLCALLIVVVKFPVLYFLQYHLTHNMKIFYPYDVAIYFSTTILCSKGIGSG